MDPLQIDVHRFAPEFDMGIRSGGGGALLLLPNQKLKKKKKDSAFCSWKLENGHCICMHACKLLIPAKASNPISIYWLILGTHRCFTTIYYSMGASMLNFLCFWTLVLRRPWRIYKSLSLFSLQLTCNLSLVDF